MNRFESIRIEGFRRLHDVQLKLTPLNVLIGANGCGKTSLLDVFSLLADSAKGALRSTLNQLGGIDGNLTNLGAAKGGNAEFMAFTLEAAFSNSNPVEYRVSLAPRAIGYDIVDETFIEQLGHEPRTLLHIEAHNDDIRYYDFTDFKADRVQPDSAHVIAESALSQTPFLCSGPCDFQALLSSSTHYHVLDVNQLAPVRRPQQLWDAKLPGHNGEDLVSCLYMLRETAPDRFETIEATLRAGFPDFERLGFPPVAAGTLAMTWKEKASTRPFYMHELSEGTLRFLWLTTLLQSVGLTAVTMIDEPEVSLHPQLLSLMADLFREASDRTQLIVATHSESLVRFLRPSEIVAIDMDDDGAARFTRADELDLEQWLKEYTLDDLWYMGQLGGRS